MQIGQAYKRANLSGPWDCIVIGSGMGGLTTAALLAKHAGRRVLVLERHYTAGGFTHAFERPGYEWDVGVHYIGGVLHPKQTMRRVFDDISQGRLAWADMGEVYDRIIIDGERYDLRKGREAFRAQLCAYFPGRARDIDRYLARVRAACATLQPFFADKLLPAPLSATLGRLLRAPALRHARRTTAEVLSELSDDVQLRGVLAGQWGDYGLPPLQSSFLMHAMLVDHYLGGAAYPVGGAPAIARSVEPTITAAGGQIVTSAEVSQILCEGGRAVGVRMADGREVRAPRVVSDAGARLTFERLLGPEVRQVQPARAAAAEVGPSAAHLSLYLGFEASAAELRLEKTNLWIYPDADHDRNVQRFREDPEAPLPVVYVSFPSAKDPDFERRHPGKATVEVITIGDYAHFARWEGTRWHKRGAEYEALKERLSERMLQVLFQHCPQLEGRVAHQELSTPLSTRHFAAHERGEIYGLAHTPQRFRTRALRPRTALEGLYLTGADVVSGGVGGAMMAGVLCAASIEGRRLMQRALRRKPAIHVPVPPAPTAGQTRTEPAEQPRA